MPRHQSLQPTSPPLDLLTDGMPSPHQKNPLPQSTVTLTTSPLPHRHYAQCAQQQTGSAYGDPCRLAPKMAQTPSSPAKNANASRTLCPTPGKRSLKPPIPQGCSLSMYSAISPSSTRQPTPRPAHTS